MLMAFPEVAVLRDDFSRTENPLAGGGKWSGKIDTEDAAMEAVGGAAGGVGAVYGSARYVGYSNFTARNVEIACKVGTTPAAPVEWYAWTRVADVGTTAPDGYAVVLSGNPNQLRLNRIDNGSFTVISSVTVAAPAGGDWFGMRITGDYLEGWFRDASAGDAWVFTTEGTDTTYTAAGAVGISTAASAAATTGISEFWLGSLDPGYQQPPAPGIGGRGAGW